MSSDATGISRIVLSSVEPRAAIEHFHSWKLFMVIGSICLGIFLHSLDMNIIGVAIPQITTQFNSLDHIVWYGSSYHLTVTAFQPLFGNFYKYFNAKIIYFISITIFEIGSIISASAPNSGTLILGRSILGLGATGLLQGALAIIGYAVKLGKVPLYQGVVVSAFGISVCVGPIIEGVLTDRTSWRWCFWVNVPAGFLVVVLVTMFVTIKPKDDQVNQGLPLSTKLKHMDVVGTLIFVASICCLLLVLQLGGQKVVGRSSKAIGLFIGSGLLMVWFCVIQWKKGEYATIPLRVMKKRSIHMGAFILFSLGMNSSTYSYYLPIYFQSIQGVSATESGVRFIALVCPQIVSSVVTGVIVSRWGYYVPYIVLGIAINAVGAGLTTTITVGTPTLKWAAYLVINGIGIGMAQQLPYTALQAVLDPLDVATGNAIAVFTYQLGGALGIAIAQNLFLNELVVAIPRHTQAVPPQTVVAVGATGLVQLAASPGILFALRKAHAEAIRKALIVALVGACTGFPFAWAMEWLNIKKVAESRRAEKQSEGLGTSPPKNSNSSNSHAKE